MVVLDFWPIIKAEQYLLSMVQDRDRSTIAIFDLERDLTEDYSCKRKISAS
jgi:hypothetical protein